MTAPTFPRNEPPSAQEQREIERFGMFAEEERVEKVARAIRAEEGYPWPEGRGSWHQYEQDRLRRLAHAALSAMPPHPAEEAVRRRVEAQCEADIAYYGDSDDPMSIGRVIGVREVLHALDGAA